MQTKTVVNVVGSSALAFNLVGLFWRPIHKFISLFGDAQAAADLMDIIKGIPISWGALYLYGAILSASVLIAANWTAFHRWRTQRSARNKREWNTPVIQAITYMAESSHFGDALEGGDKLSRCVAAFRDAAASGKIKTSGIGSESAMLSPIKPHVWRDYKIDWQRGAGDGYGYRQPSIRSLVLRNGDKLIYDSIMVDWGELERIWPMKPSRY